MRRTSSNAPAEAEGKAPPGSQTLLRGLDVLEAVVDGALPLAELATKLGLTRSTTHRLASALIERRYLTFAPGLGYQLGPKLVQLGFLAQRQTDVVKVARPYLERFALSTGDTVHLGILDGDRALYLDKISGRRRVEISSRIGDRHPLTSTGLGKALLLDDQESRWRELFLYDQSTGSPKADYDVWLARMKGYVAARRAYDLEENEDFIRCVAAPIRDASGGIVAAMSVSSAAQYMADDRMELLSDEVRQTAADISHDLGWSEDIPAAKKARGRK